MSWMPPSISSSITIGDQRHGCSCSIVKFYGVALFQYDNFHAPVKGAATSRVIGLCGRVLTV